MPSPGSPVGRAAAGVFFPVAKVSAVAQAAGAPASAHNQFAKLARVLLGARASVPLEAGPAHVAGGCTAISSPPWRSASDQRKVGQPAALSALGPALQSRRQTGGGGGGWREPQTLHRRGTKNKGDEERAKSIARRMKCNKSRRPGRCGSRGRAQHLASCGAGPAEERGSVGEIAVSPLPHACTARHGGTPRAKGVMAHIQHTYSTCRAACFPKQPSLPPRTTRVQRPPPTWHNVEVLHPLVNLAGQHLRTEGERVWHEWRGD